MTSSGNGQISLADDGQLENEDGNSIPLQVTPPSYESMYSPETDVDKSSHRLLQGEGDQAASGPPSDHDKSAAEEERRNLHDQKIKKLIADLRRECSVEEVAPEEIEMMFDVPVSPYTPGRVELPFRKDNTTSNPHAPFLTSSMGLLNRTFEHPTHTHSVLPQEMERTIKLNVGNDQVCPESDDVSSLHSSHRGKDDHEQPVSVSLADEADGTDRADASMMRLSRRLSMSEMQEITSQPSVENNDIDHLRDEASVEDGTDKPKRTGVAALLAGSPTRKLIVAGSILFCLGLLLLVILLPKSFVYVNYYEYAMSRNSLTGAVDYSAVYDSGCYLLAPQDELVRFDATAHFMDQTLVIMDNTGLSIKLDIMLQYFLKRDEIPQLFQRYHYSYREVMASLVESQVKNLAVSFSLDQYRLHRQEVEAAILKRIQYALAGDCCDECCPDRCGRRAVECAAPACRPQGSCHRGHHVIVKHFQLGAIAIPEAVFERLLRRTVLQVEAEREQFFQLKAIEVKKTEQMAKNIRNQAEELRQNARALDRVIRAKAEAEKNAELEKARQTALKQVFSHFNISDQDNKLSYIYARTLAEKATNLRYVYGYGSLSASSP